MSPATDSNVVYVIVLVDTVHGASYEFFVTEQGNRLVQAAAFADRYVIHRCER